MVGAIAGGVQALTGLAQTLIGGAKARRAQKALENLQTPTTTLDPAINSFYQNAGVDPYSSGMYKMQSQNAGRSFANSVSALNSRGGNSSSIQGLLRGYNDSLLRAGVSAEQQRNQLMGQATRMRASDNQRVWEVNKLMPYQKQFSLLGQKASGANQIMNAGLHNIMGGIQTGAMDLYGNKKQQTTY
jgi:hypothetical protein